MARPRSVDKRQAILLAATRLFAQEGLSAPTARIAKEAGIAEGTLFIYFENKDVLLNQLYLELKSQLRSASELSEASTDLHETLWQAWQAYTAWSLEHPDEYRVMAKLAVAPQITEETRAQIQRTFADVVALLTKAAAQGGLQKQPPAFAAALMGAMADTTRDFMAESPSKAKTVCKSGFGAFWNALTKE